MRKGPFNPHWREEFEANRNQAHAKKISEAFELLRSYMHDADGSASPGPMQEHEFTGRRMKLAAEHLEVAEMVLSKELEG